MFSFLLPTNGFMRLFCHVQKKIASSDDKSILSGHNTIEDQQYQSVEQGDHHDG